MKNIAVIGASGLVGRTMIKILEERKFPVANLRLVSSEVSEGKKIKFCGEFLTIQSLNANTFKGIDIALFAVDAQISKEIAPKASTECIVIDNSNAFRLEPWVPLVVPEVNPEKIAENKGIIANPNCSTIQMVVALWPIYKKAGIKRVVVTTLQAASGAGRGAVEQLFSEIKEIMNQGDTGSLILDSSKNPASSIQHPASRVLPQQLAYNVFPHIGTFGEFDYTSEEWKLVKETHKIMHDDKIKISATTVRVPVRTGHSESIYLETAKPISPENARDILSQAKGVVVIDDPKKNLYPMPKDAEGKDEVFVGRIRKDPFVKNGLWLWVVADNLRKGAATNAVQIAECIISN